MTREEAHNSRKDGKEPAPTLPAPINASPHGHVLGDFELGRVIGRGGMGTVYEAWQRSLERTVAVKVLADHIAASPKSVQRFEREAQAAAKLHHTHIIPIYARGEHNGKYYYAMELIKGPSLHDIISKDRERQDAETATIDLAETVPLPRAVPPGEHSTAQSSGSVSAARTLEHTPEPWGGEATPVSLAPPFNAIATHIASIADALGYAHARGVVHRDVKPQNLILGEDGRLRIADFGLARIAQQPGVTVTGEVLGSPLYMSPEQISGEPGQVDHRTDIYSLGATMYEWLTLEPPHPGETRETVIAKILTEEVAPLRSRNPSVPVDLETLCLKALQRDPSRRFASAEEFRDDLKRFVENQPIRARRAGIIERMRKLVGRHQVLTLGTLAAMVALALGWALLDTRHEVKEQTQAAARSQEDTDRLLDLLEYIPVPAAGMMLEGLAGQAKFLAQESVGTEDVATANVSTPEGIARRATRDLYDALVPQDPTDADSDVDVSDGCTAALGTAWTNRIINPHQALGLINLCLAQNPTHAPALHLRTALLGRLEEFTRMERDADHLVRLQVDEPIGYLWRGLARLLLGQPEGCLKDVDLAARHGAQPAWVHSLRGLAMMRLNRPTDALASLDQALTEASTLIVAMLGRATAFRALGELSLAATALTQALDLEPENTDVLIARGDVLAAIGNFDAAIRDFDAAIDIGGRTPALALRVFTAMLQQRRAANPETAPNVPRGDADEATRPTETIQQEDFDWFSTFPPEDTQESSPPDATRSEDRPRGSVDQ